MLSLPIMPTQVTLRGSVCSLDVPTVAHSHLALASRVMHREGGEWSQKSAKNRDSQWYSQFAHSAHTGHVKRKCGFSGRSYSGQVFTYGPRWQGNALIGSRMVSKSQQKIGETNGMPSVPIVPTQVTLGGNVGFLDDSLCPTIHIWPFRAGY